VTLHHYGPDHPEITYVPHAFGEHTYDTGEVRLNYAVTGSADAPPLLLVPGQTESWWGYEPVLPRLGEHFRTYAVDLRGQGRSSRTPGRYTLDNMGNDLVRFITGVIGRPVIVSGLSSGGVLAAWLSAYAPPGLVRAAHYEDPPLFASEVSPSCGPSIRQSIGPMFRLYSTYLGDQWKVGDWDGMRAAGARELPGWMAEWIPEEPPQNMKEYDPEWARAFWTGTVGASCDHARMLAAVKTPVLFTHHGRYIDAGGWLIGASSDLQAARVRALITAAGQPCTYRSFPESGHSLHGENPELFTETLVGWAADAVQDRSP